MDHEVENLLTGLNIDTLPETFLFLSAFFLLSFFLPLQRVFYRPKHRRMSLGLDLVHLGVLINLVHAQRRGYHGNKHGEVFILGGSYIIGVEKQVTQSKFSL